MSQRKPTRLTVESLESRLVPTNLNLVSSASGLQDRLDAQFREASGRAGYAVVDLADGSVDAARGSEVFGTSSTIKLGVLFALMRRVDDPVVIPIFHPDVSLDTKLNVRGQYGTNQGDLLTANTSYKLRDLAVAMIDRSNNWATNRLIDYLGVGKINAAFRSLGLTQTRIDRYNTGPGSPSMHGTGGVGSDYRAGHDNESTPLELTTLLRRVHENTAGLSAASTAEFWNILGRNGTGYATADYDGSVSAGSGVSWPRSMRLAVKSGSNTWTGSPGDFRDDPALGDHFQRSEAGRVRLADGRFVLYAMFVDEAADADAAEQAIAHAGFELAREFAPGAVTVTPIGAELRDGRTVAARGTAGNDAFQIDTRDGAERLTISLNSVPLRTVRSTVRIPFTGRDIPIAFNGVTVRGGDGQDTFTVPPGTNPVRFGDIKLLGENGNDTFNVTASTTAPIRADGGAPYSGAGDRLVYRGPGTPTPPAQITRPGYKPVSYSSIEHALERPTISAVPNATIVAGRGPTAPIPFRVSDYESPVSALTVTAAVDRIVLPNRVVIVPGTVALSGAGVNRTVVFTPTPGWTGTATVRLAVRDETGLTTVRSFTVTVTPPGVVPPRTIPLSLRPVSIAPPDFDGSEATTHGVFVG